MKWAVICKLQQNANEGCKSCASLAGLLACFVVVVIPFSSKFLVLSQLWCGSEVTCKYEGDQPEHAATSAAPEREAGQDHVRHVGLNQRHRLRLSLIRTDHHHLLGLWHWVCRWCWWWHRLIAEVIWRRGIPVAGLSRLIHSRTCMALYLYKKYFRLWPI